jgi:subtilisin family serine protease
MGSRKRNIGTSGSVAGRIAAAGLAALVVALIGPPVAAQLPNLLEDVIDDAIDQQVEEQLEETVEVAVEEQIVEQVEAAVVETVEQQIESEVTDTIGQQVEAAVTETIEQQIESGVAGTLEQLVESGVTGAITQQLESTLERTIDADLDDALEQGVGGIERGLEGIVQGATDAVDGASVPGATPEASAAAQPFVGDLDDSGRAIERDVWIILLPAEHIARIDGWGFTIRAQQTLAALDRVLLRVDAPEDRDIAQAALDLALDAPGTTVDFNHVFRSGAEKDEAAGPVTTHAGMPQATAAPVARTPVAITVGVIDSAVAVEHAAFRAADIVQKDFVPFSDARPLRHGTAVASILVGDRGALSDLPGGARLYTASVFFEDAQGSPAATTASLVEALGWLADEGVPVVNASLAGPANRVLEAAIEELAGRGVLVVAAVGNNGPAGEPLYPAAYESVVAVTAVDSANRIYRYANRGHHVTFAAPGVRIRIADADGGYDNETGTSMAAPYAAAVIARSVAAHIAPRIEDVLATLKAAAIDLGDKDFDRVYGYGLIAAID